MEKTTQTSDVLEILTAQHAEMDRLFEAIESDKGDRADLFHELANILAAHSTVEEKVFYPAVMADATSDMLHESVEEHLAIKRVLADLLDLDPVADPEEFDAKLQVMKEQVAHHAHEEEEAKLFPKVKKMLDAAQREGLGSDLIAMFEDLMEGEPAEKVPGETTEAAPLPA